ncbi:MAG: hypothetical protein RL447_130 [Bacteroidota bacterium]
MKTAIALVTGGYSGEAVISYRTADTIQQHLESDHYQVYRIDIRKDGWWYSASEEKNIEVDKNDFSIRVDGKHICFDAVFVAMHGTPGEDGRLLGYFDMLGIPYTCCPTATSVVTFNKWYATSIAGAAGIPVARSILFERGGDLTKAAASIRQGLKFPVFVKPNNGGSSIGMSKLNLNTDDVVAALEKAFQEDGQVLVEEMVQGREFTVGVYKDPSGIVVLPITEVVADTDQPFFDFVAKYQGKSTEITPAEIPVNMTEKLQDTAKKIYAVFDCAGVVRIDFIYEPEQDIPYMLEVNTIPGQSSASIIPQQVQAAGMKLSQFYSQLLQVTLSKHAKTPNAV